MYCIDTRAEKMLEEPSFELFRHANLLCLIKRMPPGFLNGYVAITKEHILYGVSYDDIKGIEVHGGLTYSDFNLIDHNVFNSDLWWFGFDTDHFRDLRPICNNSHKVFADEDMYRNFEYVESETKKLADQLYSYNFKEDVK